MNHVALRNLIAFILCCQSIWIFSQNLVPNGDFEKHSMFDFRSYVPEWNISELSDWNVNSNSVVTYCHRDMIKRYGSKAMRESGSWLNFDSLHLLQGDAMVKLFYHENCTDLDLSLIHI